MEKDKWRDEEELRRVAGKVHSKEWFDYCFGGNLKSIPQDLRKASERICRSYGIGGICDPGYIANVIALELGLGDGMSNFKDK